MNKKMLLIVLLLGVFISSVPIKVYADDVGSKNGCPDYILGTSDYKENRCGDPEKCEKKYQDPAYYLQLGLNIVKYAGVIACIALSVVDFVKTLLSDDKDGYKKVINKTLKRMAYAVVIFVLPILVMQVLKLMGIAASDACVGIK